ncbi:MAG: endosialidase [Eubacteriales bacterium]
MAVIVELIREEADNTISFGNYLLEQKKKVLDFEVNGDIYKVKTYDEITKLEKNGILLYESVPGTTVHNFNLTDKEVDFTVEGVEDAQITIELEAEKDYKLLVDEVNVGKVKSNLSGKINFSVDFDDKGKRVQIKKI